MHPGQRIRGSGSAPRVESRSNLSVSLRRGIELLGEYAVPRAVTRAIAFCRRSRVGSACALGMCVLTMVGSLAACGEAPTPPNEAVQNYLNALGAGNYANACGFLDTQARESLVRTAPARSTCAEIFHRCLPHKTIVLKQDETQLLYANIDVTQNVYARAGGKIEWTRSSSCRSRSQCAQNAEIEAKKNQPESVSNGCGFHAAGCHWGISRAAYSPLRGMPELPHSVSRVP